MSFYAHREHDASTNEVISLGCRVREGFLEVVTPEIVFE